MKGKKKNQLTMNEVTSKYEKFIEGKEVAKSSKQKFEKAIKKATKLRGSK